MSIQMLKKRFAGRLGRGILYALIATFIIALPFMFGAGSGGGIFGKGQGQGQQPQADESAVVAKVNGEPLTRAQYEAVFQNVLGQERQVQMLYAQYGQNTGGIGIERLMRLRLQALQQAEGLALIMQDAKARGLSVSDREVEDRISQQVEQEVSSLKAQSKEQKPEQLERVYAQIVQSSGGPQAASMSESDFRDWLRNVFREKGRDQLVQQLTIDKVKGAVAPQHTVSDAELQASYDTVTAREIVVALHPTGKPARTEEQAKKRAEELLAKVKGGADFAALATAESDDASAKKTGGLRAAPYQVRDMDPQWLKLVAPLKVGEVASEPLKQEFGGQVFGYDVVKVEKRERKLPPDFEKNKQQEMNSLAQQRQEAEWQAYAQQAMAKAKLELVDPEFQGYEALAKGKTEEGLKKLEEATAGAEKMTPIGAASVFYQIATYDAARNKWEQAAAMYERADNYAANAENGLPDARVQTLMGMARAYENWSKQLKGQGKPKQAETELRTALDWYQAASDATEQPSYHSQLKQVYTQLGRPDLAQAEQKKLDDLMKQEQERLQAMAAQQKAMEAQQAKPRPAGPSPVAGAKPGAPAKPGAAPQPVTAPARPAGPAKPGGPSAKPLPPPAKPAAPTKP